MKRTQQIMLAPYMVRSLDRFWQMLLEDENMERFHLLEMAVVTDLMYRKSEQIAYVQKDQIWKLTRAELLSLGRLLLVKGIPGDMPELFIGCSHVLDAVNFEIHRMNAQAARYDGVLDKTISF